jgi:hypothetical protein
MALQQSRVDHWAVATYRAQRPCSRKYSWGKGLMAVTGPQRFGGHAHTHTHSCTPTHIHSQTHTLNSR